LNDPARVNREGAKATKAMEPPSKKRKRGTPNQKTGLIGVSKRGDKYRSSLRYGGKTTSLGVFETKEQAGIAYDRFVVDKSTEEVSYALNYPKMSNHEREAALKVEEPVQQKRGTANKTSGLIGVRKNGNKYQARITYGGTETHLGSFNTKEQAGIAYDRFVVDKSTKKVSYTLNYPNGLSSKKRKFSNTGRAGSKKKKSKAAPTTNGGGQQDKDDALPTRVERGLPNPATGLIGVHQARGKYCAQIVLEGKRHHLGTFATKEQAAVAYDQFVFDQSTEEVLFVLNYPHMFPTSGTSGTSGARNDVRREKEPVESGEEDRELTFAQILKAPPRARAEAYWNRMFQQQTSKF